MPLAVAMKLNILVHYLVGFAGMHLLLTRSFRLSYAPAVIFLAAHFTLAGGAAFHLIVGHATFLPYFYLPWMLFFFLAALETGALRHTAGAAATIALGIYAGGTHVVSMGAVGLGFFALAMSALRRDWRPIALLAAYRRARGPLRRAEADSAAPLRHDADLVDIRYFLPEPDRITPAMLQHLFTDAHQTQAAVSRPAVRMAGICQLPRAARPAAHRRQLRVDADRSSVAPR